MQINKINKIGFINLTLFLTVIFLIGLKLLSFNYFQYNVFTDRDLIRARDLLDNFQLYGAELNYLDGLRIYGGFYYYYLWILTSIISDINFIFLYFEIAIFFSLLYLIYVLRDFGFRSALISFIFFYTSLNYIPESIILWNPNMGFHICILSYAFFFKYLINKNYFNLFISFLLSFLAAQFHLSFLIPIVCIYLITICIDYKKILNFFIINLIIFFSILVSYFPFLLNYFYNFQYENLIEIENVISSESNINFLFFLKSKLSQLFYLQSFTEISLITNYKIPFMAFLILGVSLFIFQSKKMFFESIYGPYFYINYKYLGLILIVTLFLNSIILTFFINYENTNIIGYFHVAELRYLTFIIPILSISCGVAFTILIDFFSTKKTPSTIFIILIILIFLFSRSFFVLISNFKDLSGQSERSKYYQSFSLADNLIDIAINDYNFSKKDILNNFSITTVHNNQIKASLINHQHIVESKTNNDSKLNKNCLIAVVDYKSIERNDINRMFDDFGIKNYKINKIDNYDLKRTKIFKSTFVYFETRNSSCPSSMYNSYILTEKEKQIEDFLKLKESNYSFVEKISDNALSSKFKINIPKSNYPLNIGFDFVFKESEFEVFLNAKRLRNLTQLDGYWEKVLILNPKLEFINVIDNKKYKFDIHKGLLGSPLFNSPWFNEFSKPPKGIYKINFLAEEIYEGKNVSNDKTNLDTLKIKDYNIEIINNFEIN